MINKTNKILGIILLISLNSVSAFGFYKWNWKKPLVITTAAASAIAYSSINKQNIMFNVGKSIGLFNSKSNFYSGLNTYNKVLKEPKSKDSFLPQSGFDLIKRIYLLTESTIALMELIKRYSNYSECNSIGADLGCGTGLGLAAVTLYKLIKV